MHYPLLVIGENYKNQLAPFDMELKVKPYTENCFCTFDGGLVKRAKPNCETCKGTGSYLSQYNPRGMYDWYVLGGRFRGFFTVKPDRLVIAGKNIGDNQPLPVNKGDQVRKGDIDWQRMRHDAEEKASQWWDQGQKENSLYLYGIQPNETRTQYMKRKSHLLTTSQAILKNGTWYSADEKTTQNWEAEWKEIVMSLPDYTLLSLVDIHC